MDEETTGRPESLDSFVGRMRDAVRRAWPVRRPRTEVPRKAPTRDVRDIEEIDDVGPADEVRPPFRDGEGPGV